MRIKAQWVKTWIKTTVDSNFNDKQHNILVDCIMKVAHLRKLKNHSNFSCVRIKLPHITPKENRYGAI